jgi:transcriptional regulator with XRE-family HTH domain
MADKVAVMGTYGADIQSAMAVQIKAEMAARDWRQSDLSKATGIVSSTLHRYLSGARDIPLPVFAEIAQALGLSMIELAARAQRRLDGENVQ